MKIKPELNLDDITQLHPNIYPILGYLFEFCFTRELPCLITSMIRPGDPGPHRQGRAIDISIRGWKELQIEEFKFNLENKYGYLGAYSRKDLVQRVIVDHGPVRHLHIQVKQ